MMLRGTPQRCRDAGGDPTHGRKGLSRVCIDRAGDVHVFLEVHDDPEHAGIGKGHVEMSEALDRC